MSTDPELDRLGEVKQLALTAWVGLLDDVDDAMRLADVSEDVYDAANSAYDNHEGSLR